MHGKNQLDAKMREKALNEGNRSRSPEMENTEEEAAFTALTESGAVGTEIRDSFKTC
jgi:hypothetical protein